MAKIHGKFGKLYFDGSPLPGALSPIEVLNCHKWTLTTDADIEDATDFNSAGWREFITGCIGYTASVEGWWNTNEAALIGGATTIAPIFAGNNAAAEFYVDKAHAPGQFFGANFLVASAEFDCDTKGNVTWKMSLTGNGQMTVGPSGLLP